MFRIRVVEKIKTHILYSIKFFRKSYLLWDNAGKIWQIQTGHRWHYNMAHAFCMPDNYGYTHTLRIRNNSFTWQHRLRERVSMLRLYVHWLYLHSFIKPTTHTCFGTDIKCHHQGLLVPSLNPDTNGFNHPGVSLLILRCAFGWFNKAIHWSETHGMDRFKITASLV